MKLNLECVGQTFNPAPFDYAWHHCALYALGIGASVDDLAFVWEGANAFKVYPSFAVIPTQPIIILRRFIDSMPILRH